MKRFAVMMVAFALAAGASAYNANREALEWNSGYYQRPDPYAVEVSSNLLPQQSQNLFWDKLGLSNSFQGSNQVGGNGWWSSFTQKFPFINGLFSSRMELPPGYGVPAPTYGVPAPTYGAPPPTFYRNPTPQFYYPVRQFFPPGVQVTDDAVVVSAPGVPPFNPGVPPFAPPAPSPVAPSPPAAGGYDYPRPQYRLDLPNSNNIK